MRNKSIILSTGAVLALVGGMAATPAFARTHHHMGSQSTPEERAATAQLNNEQLTQPGLAGVQAVTGGIAAGNGANLQGGEGGTGLGQTGYSPSGASPQPSGTMPPNENSAPPPAAASGQPSNPSSESPPPVNPSGTPQ